MSNKKELLIKKKSFYEKKLKRYQDLESLKEHIKLGIILLKEEDRSVTINLIHEPKKWTSDKRKPHVITINEPDLLEEIKNIIESKLIKCEKEIKEFKFEPELNYDEQI